MVFTGVTVLMQTEICRPQLQATQLLLTHLCYTSRQFDLQYIAFQTWNLDWTCTFIMHVSGFIVNDSLASSLKCSNLLHIWLSFQIGIRSVSSRSIALRNKSDYTRSQMSFHVDLAISKADVHENVFASDSCSEFSRSLTFNFNCTSKCQPSKEKGTASDVKMLSLLNQIPVSGWQWHITSCVTAENLDSFKASLRP